MKKLIFLCILCMSVWANAHTIWLETNTNGKLNKPHQVKVFYGEFEDPNFTHKWFSDLKDFKLVLISPSGKQEILEKKQEEAYFSSFFTPTENGTYTLWVKHIPKDTFREMKITYQAVAFVNVGKVSEKEFVTGENFQLGFLNTNPKLNKKYMVKTIKDGAVTKGEILVEFKNGWQRPERSNVRGEASFTPLWKGKYLVSHRLSTAEEGEHNNKAYKTNYQWINMVVEVK